MRLAIYLLFLLSGFVALIYEGIWTRYLKLFLGHSSYGQIITLMTFMGGIGLGSFLAAKYLKKVNNPFRAYAIIEIALAISALMFHSLYGGITGFFFENAEAFSKFFWVGKAVQVFLCLLMTLPFSTLLGLTYPLIAAGLMRHTGDGGKKSLPTLYFINSLGGAAGILVTSYFFIANFGTNGTLLLAGLGNTIVAVGFYIISKHAAPAAQQAPKPQKNRKRRGSLASIPPETIKLWLAVSLGTGFASFIYEVGWIRLLSLILGSSTHSFDVMISAFILGLAFGGLFASRLLKKPGADITKTMATVQILMGCFAVISLFLYRPLFEAIRSSHSLIMKTEEAYAIYSIYKYLLALVLMFPAAFCAGITLPLITYFLVKNTGNEKYTGSVYGWNTIGSIIGAAAGGMLLMPLLQLKWTIFFGAALDIGLGVALLLSIRKFTPELNLYKKFAYGVIAVCVVPAAFVSFDETLLSRGYFRHVAKGETEILGYKDGRTATIAALKTGNSMSLKTNGKSDGGIYMEFPKEKTGISADEATVAQLAALPMMTRDKDYNAAVIGMGTGMTLHYLLSDNRLQEVDLIEIEPAVIDMAENFRPRNERCYTDERVNFVIDDAKSYFYGNRKSYDIIISEPSNPWVSGVASLFTKEFYRHIQTFLKPDGVFVQWVHGYEFSDDLMVSILAALAEFKEFEVYKVHQNNGDFMILAGNSPIDIKDVQLLAKNSSFEKDLEPFGEKLINLGPKNFLVSSKSLAAVLNDCRNMANSDYFPYVEQHSENAFFLKQEIRIFGEYTNSFSRYGDLFDPKREALFRKHCEEAGVKLSENPSGSLLRDAIKGAGKGTDWQYLERSVLKYTGEMFSSGKWHETDMVKDFYRKLKENEAPKSVVSRVEFLLAVSKRDKEGVQTGLTELLKHNDKSKINNLPWKRTLTVNICRMGTAEQIEDWKSVLADSKEMSPYEIANFKQAVAVGETIQMFQNQSMPVSLKE